MYKFGINTPTTLIAEYKYLDVELTNESIPKKTLLPDGLKETAISIQKIEGELVNDSKEFVKKGNVWVGINDDDNPVNSSKFRRTLMFVFFFALCSIPFLGIAVYKIRQVQKISKP